MMIGALAGDSFALSCLFSRGSAESARVMLCLFRRLPLTWHPMSWLG